MAGSVNPQLSLPPPSDPSPPSILQTFTQWANSLVTQLFSYGQRINLCLPKDGSEAMTGRLTTKGITDTATVVLAADPTTNLEAATKQYVDTGVASATAAKPKFRAHQAVAQSIPTTSAVPLVWDTVDFNVGNFTLSADKTKITPSVAGYYRVSGWFALTVSTIYAAFIMKNGALTVETTQQNIGGNTLTMPATDIVYCNGTTDYIQFSAFQQSGASQNTVTANNTTTITIEYLA